MSLRFGDSVGAVSHRFKRHNASPVIAPGIKPPWQVEAQRRRRVANGIELGTKRRELGGGQAAMGRNVRRSHFGTGSVVADFKTI